MSEVELQCTPPEILEAAKEIVEKLLPTKSCGVYEASYQKFVKWCVDRNVTVYSENVLLTYFSEMAKHMKSSSLWSHYSMVKSLLNLRHDVNISKYLKLRAFLKKEGEGYKPKKAKVLSKEQFDKFWSEAPDEKYLATKIVLLFGISGACRCHELANMKVHDIEDLKNLIFVKIPETKTNNSRSFTIVGEQYVAKYRQYASLRPSGFGDQRFFVKYQNGKCYRMVMGIHKLGNAAKEVASYLTLPNWKEYTGHSLRRTSATLLVDRGGDITALKRHGGWRSSSVAEGYIEESMENKKDIANRILQPKEGTKPDNEPGTSKEVVESITLKNKVINSKLSDVATSGIFVNASLSNCTFTINVNK